MIGSHFYLKTNRDNGCNQRFVAVFCFELTVCCPKNPLTRDKL